MFHKRAEEQSNKDRSSKLKYDLFSLPYVVLLLALYICMMHLCINARMFLKKQYYYNILVCHLPVDIVDFNRVTVRSFLTSHSKTKQHKIIFKIY